MEGRYVTIARVRKETQRLKATKLHVTVLQEQTKSDISTKKRQQPHALFRNLSKTLIYWNRKFGHQGDSPRKNNHMSVLVPICWMLKLPGSLSNQRICSSSAQDWLP